MNRSMKTMDGNSAAAHVAYAYTDVAAIYPITPSSPMAEKVDEWSAKGRKNLFGSTVDVIQMQSEAGAAGTCHGSLQAGALTTTFTSSQGLMLMIPAMYAMGGQFLPSVMHIASRVVTSNHHSIFGDHTDFMTCRMTGYAMLMSSCPQEAMDLAAVAHLSAISGRYAFMHCFDGFRTSHEMQRIEALDYEDLRGLVDQEALQAFRHQSLNPEHPTNRGNNVNPDVYFQCKEGANVKANALPDTVQHYLDEIYKLTGRDYKLFYYYGAPDAEEVIVVMCSASETVKETVDYLNAQGRKVGMVQIHLYRPFSESHFAAAIPATCKRIAVLDRNKETGSVGEPVYLDVVTALNQAGRGDIRVVGGRYGLSSKDTTPGQIVAVYDNLEKDEPKNNFTIGINDDVTFTSLDYKEIELPHPGQISCKLWGLGGDGTVGANKNAISTIGFVGGKYAQAYFSYDTMKSGGLTQSHLRFGDEPILSTYLVSSADFVACHAPTYVSKYDLTEDLKEGGTFLLNCPWTVEELDAHLPAKMKRDLARKHANFYIIDAAKLAQEIGLGKRTNNILQGAFFALTKVIPMDLAIEDMKKNNYNSYFKKAGQKIVDLNDQAVDLGVSAAVKVEIPAYGSGSETPDTGKFTITINAPKGGTITTNRTKADKGDEIIVTVAPNNGYQMAEGSLTYSLAVAGGETVKITGNRFTMPAGNVTITCKWETATTTAKGITSFSISGVVGAVNNTTNTITITLPRGTDVTKLTPVIATNGVKSLTPGSGETVNFTNAVTYTAAMEDGSSKTYTVTGYEDKGTLADQIWDKLTDFATQVPWWQYAEKQQSTSKYPKYW